MGYGSTLRHHTQSNQRKRPIPESTLHAAVCVLTALCLLGEVRGTIRKVTRFAQSFIDIPNAARVRTLTDLMARKPEGVHKFIAKQVSDKRAAKMKARYPTRPIPRRAQLPPVQTPGL